jgi:hypothetical protein
MKSLGQKLETPEERAEEESEAGDGDGDPLHAED